MIPAGRTLLAAAWLAVCSSDASAQSHARGGARVGALQELRLEASVLRELAALCTTRGEHAAALVELDRCVELDRAAGLAHALANDQRRRGDAFTWLGRPVAALGAYEEAARTAREGGFDSPVPLAQLGAWYAWFGRYDEAKALLDEALAAAGDDAAARARTLSTLATLESALGRYAEALRLLDRSLAASRVAQDVAGEGMTLVLKGGIETELGRSEAAERTIRAGLEKLDEETMGIQRAYAWMQIGLARIDGGRAAEALPMLDRAQEEFAARDFEVGRAEVLQHRARALLDLGLLTEAHIAWFQAAELRREGKNPFYLALALTGMGEVREKLGEPRLALRDYAEALEAAAEVDTPEARWRAHYGMGRALERTGRGEEALASYRAATRDVESIRTGLESPALRLAFLEDKLGLYRRSARLLARAGKLDAAFRESEAAKSRTLLERFRASGTERGPDADATGTRARLARAEAELTLIELKASSALRASPTQEVRAEFTARLATARATHTEALRALAREAPWRTSLSGEAPAPSLASVRARLPAGTAVVEYLLGREVRAAFVVRRDRVRFIELEATMEEVAGWVDRLRAPALDLRSGRSTLSNLSFDTKAARACYDALVRPLAAELESCDTVWIVPDGPLWGAPFAAFVASRERRRVDPSRQYVQHRGCRFWIDSAAIGVLPCAGILAERPGRGDESDAQRPPLLLADPVPLPRGGPALGAAQREVEAALRALRPRGPRLVRGEDATERGVKSALSGSSWIHFAVHGELNETSPAYSRLVLAPGSGEDGYLHAFEIEDLELQAEHVVLSACETAGAARAGEGVLGLPRAFLIAGARSVLASTWTIDDAATAELMRRYYAALAQGQAPISALRTAQIGMLREAGREGLSYAHPFFWAGFLFVGSP